MTNIVHGRNHGIQTDVVNGPLHFGAPRGPGPHGDATGNRPSADALPDPTGGVRFRPDGGLDITGPDGHRIQLGGVTGEIRINGRRVR